MQSSPHSNVEIAPSCAFHLSSLNMFFVSMPPGESGMFQNDSEISNLSSVRFVSLAV